MTAGKYRTPVVVEKAFRRDDYEDTDREWMELPFSTDMASIDSTPTAQSVPGIDVNRIESIVSLRWQRLYESLIANVDLHRFRTTDRHRQTLNIKSGSKQGSEAVFVCTTQPADQQET